MLRMLQADGIIKILIMRELIPVNRRLRPFPALREFAEFLILRE